MSIYNQLGGVVPSSISTVGSASGNVLASNGSTTIWKGLGSTDIAGFDAAAQVAVGVDTGLNATNAVMVDVANGMLSSAVEKFMIDVNFNGNKIFNLADPTAGTDGANKQFVDAEIAAYVVPATHIAPGGNNTSLLTDGSGVVGWGVNPGDVPAVSSATAGLTLVSGFNTPYAPTWNSASGTFLLLFRSATGPTNNPLYRLEINGGQTNFITLTLPYNPSSNRDVLQTDGAGHLSWCAGSQISDIKHSLQNSNHGGATGNGWIKCDGSGYSTTTYSLLFAVIAYSFGGSGATFNVPNLGGKILGAVTGPNLSSAPHTSGSSTGAESVVLGVANLPSHTHPVVITDPQHTHSAVLQPSTGATVPAGAGGYPVSGFTGNQTISNWPTVNVSTVGTGISAVANTNAAFTSTAFSTMQPTVFVGNYFIYSGV